MKVFLCMVGLLLSWHPQAQVAKRFDVLIHEIFPDPNPSVGLPGSEFIELRNNSAIPFNLRNWKISDGSSTATISTNYILQADSCVVVCPAAALPAFSALGQAIGVTGFPSLNNDADMIWLISPEGRIIHAIAYESSWYQNAVKSEGGWTLEMIDPQNPCGGADNWRASRNTMGGTPGKKNSVEGVNPDTQPPALIRTYTLDSSAVVAVFDEPLDSGSAAIISHYKPDKGLAVVQALPAGPLFKQVNITIADRLSRDSVYTLTITGVTDCAGNGIGLLNTAPAGLPSEAGPGDLVINELLFNPKPDGTDYVEFYNRSNKILDISGLYVAGRNTNGNITALRKLSETPFLLFPAGYVVLTGDATRIQAQYVTRHPLNMITGQLPSMPDDKGTVLLLNAQGVVIDELSYHEKWHFPLIANREGVALERIDPGLPAQNKDNWTSAASDAGFGTPTYRNSQYRNFQSLNGKIEIVPAVFSPDNDGYDDLCFIHYQLSAPNNVGSITVFDIKGTSVRNLCRNATLSEKGFYRWDGLDNNGNKLPTGIYIVLTELFDLNGHTKNFKNTVTLGRRF